MKILEDSKGNVPAHKCMKMKTAKDGRRTLLLERVQFQPESREDTVYSVCIQFYMQPLVDSAWTHPATGHFRSPAGLERLMIFQKPRVLPDTGKEAWKYEIPYAI